VDDLHNWGKPGDQFAISVPIDFECVRLVFEELKHFIGRIATSKLVGKRVLVKVYANLLVIVLEGFVQNHLKRSSRHFVDSSSKKYAFLRPNRW
jgi:hypothetical protein